jgi:ADP-ribose pyrophosphatase YjhB (NUDIX family)
VNRILPQKPRIALKRRRSIFTNSRFTVYSDHIVAAPLEVLDFLVVAPHGDRDDLLTGVAVVPVRAGAILLLNHYRHPVSQFVWELPRGFIDAGEEPADAARRELEEESGMVCGRQDLISLGTFFPDPGILQARVALFAALASGEGAHRDDEIGIHDRVWYPEEKVYAMLLEGAIIEGATSVALHRYFAYRRQESNHGPA